MNVNALFINRPTSRPEPTSRRDAVQRPDYASPDSSRMDDATGGEGISQSEHASSSDDVQRADERGGIRKSRKPSTSEFSALLALLAGAGPQVRAELQSQVPPDRAALIDSILNGGTTVSDSADWGAQADGYVEPASVDIDIFPSSTNATDMLHYGMLNDNAKQGIATALNAMASNTSRQGGDHAQEVLSRIASRYAAGPDQLKARGDNKGADLRIALDNLLSQAGTPSGLELASGITSNNNAAEHAALAAVAAALAAAKAGSGTDVTTPVRDTSILQPELQQKLDRVISRMKNEFGHDVQVVETARTQERQDYLFEQGRSRPGAVVTWTKNSAHTQGAAVDVMVDGSWNNAEGYARLQRVAQEEGLRTLGSKDPGHLELESSSLTGQNVAMLRDRPAPQASATGAAHPSGHAGVAQVASVAGVAQVASPGAASPRGYANGLERTDAPTDTAAPVVNVAAPASANGQGNAFGRGPRDEEGKPLNDGRKLGIERRESTDSSDVPAFGPPQGIATATTSHTSNAGAQATGINRAEQVSDVQALKDSVPAGQVSRLTLNVDGADGGQDRITVDLRGNSVNTQINTDVASAERLRMRTAELQDALGRHGLESESVRVAGATRAEGTDARLTVGERDALRVSVAQNSAANDSTLNQGQRDRSANAREWDRPDTSRQSRDERRDSARQGAGQSDQRETPYRSAR
jgi:hypothetical protein